MSILESSFIKEQAKSLGFSACGIAKAQPVDADTATSYRKWIENGFEADMAYMANYMEKRLNPELLVPGVRTILSLALNYAPAKTLPEEEFQFASYALGQDYHTLMKEKLQQLVRLIIPGSLLEECLIPGKETVRCFCDTAPVLERYWAQRAGIGWIGRNHQLIIPHAGSMFFLGEVFLPFDADIYDEPMPSRCGTCHKCIDACPTKAIGIQKDFDSDKCLSYQLIENRSPLSDLAKENMGNTIYGCDRCQTACPWNRFATPNAEPALQPRPELLSMKKQDWYNLSIDDYRHLFKGSAVKRVKYDGLMRNIEATKE